MIENFVKDLFYKLGIYQYTKKYLPKPYHALLGLMFKLSSKKAIKQLIKTMNENNYRYWLEFGTLLGAVREKGFISHDCDIDIAMYIDDRDPNLENILQLNGFKLKKRARLLSGDLIEETYHYKSARIDFFYAYKMDGQIKIFDYQTMNNLSPNECMKKYGGLRVFENIIPEHDLLKYEFYGSETWIPENYQLHLQELYGSNFMMKNKNWDMNSSSTRHETSLLATVEYL
jgi:phosphorylcholine metabolism protein LicD